MKETSSFALTRPIAGACEGAACVAVQLTRRSHVYATCQGAPASSPPGCDQWCHPSLVSVVTFTTQTTDVHRLLKSEGSLLCVAGEGEKDGQVASAIAASLWQTYTAAGNVSSIALQTEVGGRSEAAPSHWTLALGDIVMELANRIRTERPRSHRASRGAAACADSRELCWIRPTEC